MKKSPQKGREQEVRRKQIETTLTELHRLQAEIYQLNIPENPHSSAPVKKQVKQLTYLYENMIKPKSKNSLCIEKEDISKAINFIQGSSGEGPSFIETKKLSALMKKTFGGDLEVGLIKKGDSKASTITAQELYEFINFNEFDTFDPLKQTYDLFVDDVGKFDFTKYKQMHDLLGLPPITRQAAIKETLGLSPTENFSFEHFCKLMKSTQ